MDYINDNVTKYYTQILNGKRIDENKVVYIFDEVGGGKTISAIMAVANQLQKNMQSKILVLTPLSVCEQFESEIKNRLNIERLNVKIIPFYQNAENNLPDQEACIVISNPHYSKTSKIAEQNIKFDLIIIDEPQDIVCDSKKQSQAWEKKSIILNQYRQLCSRANVSDILLNWCSSWNGCNECNKKNGNKCNYNSNKPMDYESVTVKQLHLAANTISLAYLCFGKDCKFETQARLDENKTFYECTKLNAEKVMYLSATPYRYEKVTDFYNYALLATRIIDGDRDTLKCIGEIYNSKYEPDFSWIKDFYSIENNYDNIIKMKNANTSLFFKEIVNSSDIDNNSCDYTPKLRIVDIWDEKSNNNSQDNKCHGAVLREKLKEILKSQDNTGDKPNRVIIFISDRFEGEDILKCLLEKNTIIQDDYGINSIAKVSKGLYLEDVSYSFVMGIFGNKEKLNSYKDKNNPIPDILIVSYKVAQVGINLPMFNYCINYHIPAEPGSLEQRYGRIDRMNTEYTSLHNIYYLTNSPYTQIYRSNLMQAFERYIYNIVQSNEALPVKNLLLCDRFKSQIEEIKNTLPNLIESISILSLLLVYKYEHYTNKEEVKCLAKFLKDELDGMGDYKIEVNPEDPYVIYYTAPDRNREIQENNKILISKQEGNNRCYIVELPNKPFRYSENFEECQFEEDVDCDKDHGSKESKDNENLHDIDRQIRKLKAFINSNKTIEESINKIIENLDMNIYREAGCIIYNKSTFNIEDLVKTIKCAFREYN